MRMFNFPCFSDLSNLVVKKVSLFEQSTYSQMPCLSFLGGGVTTIQRQTQNITDKNIASTKIRQ
jgi:hypothetical protein